MGQYGNQPDFGTRAVAITPKGFAGGSYVNVSYQDGDNNTEIAPFTNTNLNVSTFRDGVAILKASNLTEWNDYCDSGEECWAYYNFDDSFTKFGKIYNKFAVQNNNLYSQGYRMWESGVLNQMSQDLYNPDLGLKLKSIPTGADGKDVDGTTLWLYAQDRQGEDTFGFTALPGPIFQDNTWSNQGEYAGFWTDDSSIFAELAYTNLTIKKQDVKSIYDGYYVRLQVDTDPDPAKAPVKPEPLNSAALYVGTGGDLIVTIVGSKTPVMFKNVPDASFLPIIVSNVWERGDDGLTTASDIIAIY
jgi:uncharacterized protein (TIGR02145 family)